jgi:hypothetical protein
MLSSIPITEGFQIIHAKGCTYEEALAGVVVQVKALEKDWHVSLISNTSCKGDDNPRVTDLYHATQTVVLETKE